jgi:hypothetical protein
LTGPMTLSSALIFLLSPAYRTFLMMLIGHPLSGFRRDVGQGDPKRAAARHLMSSSFSLTA